MKEEELIKNRHTKESQRLLFDTFYHDMYQVSHRYLQKKQDVQDVLCEAFVRVFNKLENFEYRGEGSLRRWIKTIVINESLRLIEKNKKFAFNDDLDQADNSYQIGIDEKIDMEHVNQIIQNLPDGYRIIFMMFIIEGYSHREIANQLGISESTSKSQLFKARMQIMKELENIEVYESIRTRKKI